MIFICKNPNVFPASGSTDQHDRTRLYAARRLTRALATGHYENFTVVSLLLPRSLHQDFYNIYAYCRHADDLADEISDTSESRRALAALRQAVMRMYGSDDGNIAQSAESPAPPCSVSCAHGNQSAILTALADTIRRRDIPAKPLLDLIDAFEQDRRINRYDTFEELVGYCTRSADPVGRLVLYLCDYRDAERQRLSDFTCTALQLTNFWQDIRRDYVDRNRIYLPRQDMEHFGVSEADIAAGRCTPAFRELLRFQVDRAQALFDRGRALLPLIHPRYRTDIALFSAGGEAILNRIRALDYDTLSARPTLSKGGKFALLLRAAAIKMR